MKHKFPTNEVCERSGPPSPRVKRLPCFVIESLVASLLLVVRPGAPSSVPVTTSKALVTRSDALVPTSVALAPSSNLSAVLESLETCNRESTLRLQEPDHARG